MFWSDSCSQRLSLLRCHAGNQQCRPCPLFTVSPGFGARRGHDFSAGSKGCLVRCGIQRSDHVGSTLAPWQRDCGRHGGRCGTAKVTDVAWLRAAVGTRGPSLWMGMERSRSGSLDITNQELCCLECDHVARCHFVTTVVDANRLWCLFLLRRLNLIAVTLTHGISPLIHSRANLLDTF